MSDVPNPVIELIEHLDKLQLHLLGVHVEVHQRLFQIIAKRLDCQTTDLPNLKFMHAARLAFAGRDITRIVPLLQKLDSARNALAHSNDAAKFNSKFAEFSRDVLGPNYVESPGTLEATRRQDYSAVHFARVLVQNAAG